MPLYPPTVILRHRKENLKKCSLRGLETQEDLCFYTYPKDPLDTLMASLAGYILLTIDAPELSIQDASSGLFLIDGTWRYAEKMFHQLPQPHLFTCRSIPAHYQTAYPREQTGCQDPQRGLASVEALYIAYHILQRPKKDLLSHYYWKEAFLQKNASFL